MPYILPYKQGSRSAKALSESTDFKRIRTQNSRFKPITRTGYPKRVVNWGCTSLPEHVQGCKVLNHPDAVKNACNKLQSFRILSSNPDVNIPEWTEDHEVAQEWADSGDTVVVRELLRANSGRGITVFNKQDDLDGAPHDHQGMIPRAPLYTKYIKKQDEFRLHVMNGAVFDVQQKRRSRDVPDDEVDWKIRNTAGGFIFAREGLDVQTFSEQAKEQAVQAVKALKLDFGAVDIIYNARQDKYFVLEVNTACGLEGTTLENYTREISTLIQSI